MVRVNFAEIESFDLLPRGTYHLAVTDGEIRQHGEEADHPGNDFWSLETTVQSGELQGRKHFLTVTLPPYTAYTLANLLRATVGQHKWSEEEVEEGEFDVEIDDLIDNNLEFVASVAPQKKNSQYNNTSNFRPYDPEAWADEDMLP